jgi:hypothetical protein
MPLLHLLGAGALQFFKGAHLPFCENQLQIHLLVQARLADRLQVFWRGGPVQEAVRGCGALPLGGPGPFCLRFGFGQFFWGHQGWEQVLRPILAVSELGGHAPEAAALFRIHNLQARGA